MSAVNPNAGSMIGGTEIIISGSGFESGNKSDYKIVLSMFNGDIPCDVTSVNADSEEVTCVTRGSGKVIKVDNNGISKGKCIFNIFYFSLLRNGRFCLPPSLRYRTTRRFDFLHLCMVCTQTYAFQVHR